MALASPYEESMAAPGRELARNPDLVRDEIDRARAEFLDAMMRIRLEARRSMHWRTWVRRKPVGVLLVAFSLGYLIARKIRKDGP